MKHLWLFSIVSLLFWQCAKEEAVPVTVDFSIDVFNDDYSIPVQLVILNLTKGAEDYEWTFEGGTPEKSTNRSPGIVQYNKKGTYSITLSASNADGSSDTKTIPITIDDPVVINFEVENSIDTFSPAVFNIINTTTGATSYQWTFEGGIPATSSQKNPGTVSFKDPGDHKISLQVSNGRETYDLEKTITVKPLLIADFTYEIAFNDDDRQVPATVTFTNNSTSATSYEWMFEGATPAISVEENPVVVFSQAGNNTITLTATNGKETKTTTQTIELFENTNLRTIENVQFGINSAHNNNTKGAFFNLGERKIYSKDSVTSNNSAAIDLVFFGLNSLFQRNQFVSPDNLQNTTFETLSNAKKTKIINS